MQYFTHLLIVFFLCQAGAITQTKQVENLDRGLIAVSQNDGYILSWRLLGGEACETGFNIYLDDEKVNSQSINGATPHCLWMSPQLQTKKLLLIK